MDIVFMLLIKMCKNFNQTEDNKCLQSTMLHCVCVICAYRYIYIF